MSNKIKKISLAFALAAVIGVSVSASACTVKSKYPNARITIKFDTNEYVIDYTLYRNMYPQTVQHFIELAEAGFYNGTVIHDYKSSDWVGGAYSYKEADDGDSLGYSSAYKKSSMAEYLNSNCKESKYYELVAGGIESGTITPTVFSKMIYDAKENASVSNGDALVTLIGEFGENGHKIEDGKGLTASYGTLKTFYYKKEAKQSVFVKNSFGQILPRDYNYNCATSLFSMQVSNSTQYDASKYCVFAQLKNEDAKSKLEDLTDAISDYAASIGSTSLTASVDLQVDKEDKFAREGGREIAVKFTVISMPIIITKIEITKY